MKIAYVAHWDLSRDSGVLKKILQQTKAWREAGHKVKLFAISFGDSLWSEIDPSFVEFIYSPNIPSRFPNTLKLSRKVIAWNPDVVYLRYSFFYPGLEKITKYSPVILEINTDDLSEYKLLPKNRYYYHILTRNILLNRVRAFIFISHQIAKRFAEYTQPRAIIGNSIDLSQYPIFEEPDNNQPHLVFMGTPNQSWNGIDKLLWLVENYPEWHFDLIGFEEIQGNSPNLPNVSYHGYLDWKVYLPILGQADIGIGTLALHRKNLQETTALKVREYLACGLPTIIAYTDTDFLSPPPYLLQLSNTEDNVIQHIDTIREFVYTWKGKRVPRDEISHLDVSIKERERLEFFSRVSRH